MNRDKLELEILLREEARHDQEREKLRIYAIWALRMIYRQEIVFHQQSQSPYYICEGYLNDSEPPEYPFFNGSLSPQDFEAMRSALTRTMRVDFVENPDVPKEHRYKPTSNYTIAFPHRYSLPNGKPKYPLKLKNVDMDEYIAQLKQVAYPSKK